MTDAEDKRAQPPPACVEEAVLHSPKPIRRTGILAGQITVPDDFDTMMRDEIEAMFYGED